MYVRNGVICHYYCLLFCCNIKQNGTLDTDGILGFLTQDIRRVVERVNSAKYKFFNCRFCKKPGATIGCFVKECKMVYHFPCGLRNGINFRFTTTFDSYCKAHKGPELFKPIILRDCPVCKESLENHTKPVVLGRCCSNSNFHKECIQTYALRAGSHHLRCPICGDKDFFILEVQSQGTFVPEKDADWETENNAYRELRQKYSRCDALKCLCPSGRDRNDRYNGSIWHLLRCSSCAASAIHVNCAGSINLEDDDFVLTQWWCPTCVEVDARLQEKKNTPPDNTNTSDDESSLNSISSAETLFRAITVKRKLPMPIHQADEGENDDNSSLSSGGTLFAVVPNQPSNHSNQQEMHSSSMPSGFDLAAANVEVEAKLIQDIKGENEDVDRNRSPIPDFSFYDNQDDLSTHVSSSNSELEMFWFPPVSGETIQDNNNDDEGLGHSPDPALSSLDEDDLSTKCSSGSESEVDMDMSMPVFFPEEPLRKRKRVEVDEYTDLPAFKIREMESDENDDDQVQVRCYCERYCDDQALMQCLMCSVYLHKNCIDGLYKIYGKSPHTRCCQNCTGLPDLKMLQEIPLAGKYGAKGCEKTKDKTYYLTMVGRDELMVRRHDAVYISERGNQDLESSRILRVEKLWKDTRGIRFISGHFYYRPSEIANASTRQFYRNEIFRSTTPSEAIKMENVLGQCWILDPVTYLKGRPSATTLDDEKHVFICESWLDSKTNRILVLKLALSMHSVCMKPYAFKEFVTEMAIKKDFCVEGSANDKQSSSSSSATAGQSRRKQKTVPTDDCDDHDYYSTVLLESD